MIKQKPIKIRTQFFLLILAAGLLCFLLYTAMWKHKWQVYDFLQESNCLQKVLPCPADDFWLRLRTEALKYDIPESEEDIEGNRAIKPFFEVADEYTSICIYGLEDGLYRAGISPSFYNDSTSAAVFNKLYQWTDGHGESLCDLPVEFKNGYAQVIIQFLHPTFFLAPYFFFCLGFCVILFFIILLFFINRKMKSIILLKQKILQMAGGDLSTPIPSLRPDEIGILAHELDNLRTALKETISQEQESRQANQDLISALSHDLRTPLTILNGYLEIVKLNQSPEMHAEYLNRCLNKTDEIREITDRIFEYALVYEETEAPEFIPLPIPSLYRHLIENADFLQLTGFSVLLDLPEATPPDRVQDSLYFLGDEPLLKRIFNNLFSNIIKYGAKKEPVKITGSIENNQLSIVLTNMVKQESDGIQSTQIGLKSVRRMLELMGGTLDTEMEDDEFTARLMLPIDG